MLKAKSFRTPAAGWRLPPLSFVEHLQAVRLWRVNVFTPVKFVYCYKVLAILALNAVVFGAGLELAAWSSFKIKRLISSPAHELVGEGLPRETVSYYSSQDWAKRYWYEFRLSRKDRYYPFVGWRRAPFKGETINIDQNGIRSTPGADCRPGSFKVFAFGDSAMWGTGSPDWATIPANLQKGLEQMRQGPVCVVNFADSAYVLMQDVIMLLLQLQSGNLPNLVLFYNSGDTYAAYQTGRAGVIQNLDQIAAKFENAKKPASFIDWLRNTYSYRLVQRLIDRVSQQKQPGPKKLITYQTMGVDAEKLSDAVVQNYLEYYKMVDALAEKYRFKYLFILPPHLSLGHKRLTPEEKEMKREAESDPALSRLAKAVDRSLENQSLKYQNLHSMVDVFDDFDSSMWIDAGHATPVGNQIIAEKILNDIVQAQS